MPVSFTLTSLDSFCGGLTRFRSPVWELALELHTFQTRRPR